ncbi:MAG TPA: methyltransferase domain-containing protein [Candidatus Baltobacteraceae bacterium]|nr:methyltransferase domain-containing protein [Candidatus Baltobacteraceae bacterium]
MALPGFIREYGQRLYADAERINLQNMRDQLKKAIFTQDVLDIGCGNGQATMEIIRGTAVRHVRGIELHEPSCEMAKGRGVDVVKADLEEVLPFPDTSFDVVFSNQVIEHVADTDHFVAEIFRILRPNGVAIISTENMASWHNIVALLAGFQPFSSSNYSMKKYPLGNPIGLHSGNGEESLVTSEGMLHRRIFTTKALRQLLEAHGLSDLDVRGSGYHPLPPRIGTIEVSHAHFISAAGRKPL